MRILDIRALRRLNVRMFSVLMSLELAIAAMVGRVVLGQSLSLAEYAGIGLVVAASIGVSLLSRAASQAMEEVQPVQATGGR